MQHEKLASLTDCCADVLSNCLGVPSGGLSYILVCWSSASSSLSIRMCRCMYVCMYVHLHFYLTILMAFLSITVIAVTLLPHAHSSRPACSPTRMILTHTSVCVAAMNVSICKLPTRHSFPFPFGNFVLQKFSNTYL